MLIFLFVGLQGKRNDDSFSTKHADILWIIISFLERNLINKKMPRQSSFGDGSLEAGPAVVWSYPWHPCLKPNFHPASIPPPFVWPCKYPLGLFISLCGLCAKTLQLICLSSSSELREKRACLSHSQTHRGMLDANMQYMECFHFPVFF